MSSAGYSVDDVRRVMPAMERHYVLWLEQPFPPHDNRSYRQARTFGHVPLAAGENHYARFEFNRLTRNQ